MERQEFSFGQDIKQKNQLRDIQSSMELLGKGDLTEVKKENPEFAALAPKVANLKMVDYRCDFIIVGWRPPVQECLHS